MDYRSFVGLAGAPLILALVQLVKRTLPELSPRYYPALAWQLRTDLGLAVLVGIVTGLSASRLYTQATALGRRNPELRIQNPEGERGG